MCEKARSDRLPILLIVLPNDQPESLAQSCREVAKMSADQCAQLLATGFTLNQSALIPRANHFFTSANDHVTFYMAFVSEDNKMRLVSKVAIANNSEGGKFINFLNDGLSEFVIFCEKD